MSVNSLQLTATPCLVASHFVLAFKHRFAAKL
jgi:hypothetical protein